MWVAKHSLAIDAKRPAERPRQNMGRMAVARQILEEWG